MEVLKEYPDGRQIVELSPADVARLAMLDKLEPVFNDRLADIQRQLDLLNAKIDGQTPPEAPPAENEPGDDLPGGPPIPPGKRVFSSDFSEAANGPFPKSWENSYKRVWPTGEGAEGVEAHYVQSPVHSGPYALYAAIPGKIRAAWRVIVKGLATTKVLPRHAFYECWYFFDENIDVSGTHCQTMQWKRQATLANGSETSWPCGSFNIRNLKDGRMVWGYNHKTEIVNGEQRKVDLPLPGEPLPIPLGRWVRLRVEWKWALDKTGLVRAWQDDTLICEYTDLQTDMDCTLLNEGKGSREEENGYPYVWGVGPYSDEARAAFVMDDLAIYEVA